PHNRDLHSFPTRRSSDLKDVDEIIAELRPKLSRVPGMVVFMQNPPAIQIGGRVAKSLYQFTMQSSDIASLYPAAQRLVDSARKSDRKEHTSELQSRFDLV